MDIMRMSSLPRLILWQDNMDTTYVNSTLILDFSCLANCGKKKKKHLFGPSEQQYRGMQPYVSWNCRKKFLNVQD
jgi:hypothetical protein